MKQYLLTFLLCVGSLFGGSTQAVAQRDFYAEAATLLNQQDTAQLRTLLAEWQKAKPNDADYYAICANYCLQKYQSMARQRNNTGTPSSLDPTAGQKRWEQLLSATLKKGIATAPDRLDLRFGLIHQSIRFQNYSQALEEIEATIARSAVNKNLWRWTGDKQHKYSEEEFAESFLEYFTELWKLQRIDDAERVMLTFLRTYPKDWGFRSNRASIQGERGDFQGAIATLEELYRENRKDEINQYNLAYCYEQIGDKAKAIKHYRILAKSKKPSMAQEAQKKLRALGERE